MNRRSSAVTGYVNFPIDDPNYTNSREGGMFVRLVVMDKSMGNGWMQCCGGDNLCLYDEDFVGSDGGEDEATLFPRMNDDIKSDDLDFYTKYMSYPFLAVLTIGSTGWSGWNDFEGRQFVCTYNDLTEKGKRLYDSLKELYKGCELRLLTWLDT